MRRAPVQTHARRGPTTFTTFSKLVTNRTPNSFPTRALFLAGLAGFVFSLSIAALAEANSPPDSTQPLSLSAYAAELDRWDAALGRWEKHPEEARALRQQLPDFWNVAADGQHFDVSTYWLQTGLQTLEKNPRARSRVLQERLEAMRREAEELVRGQQRSDAPVRQKLSAILARREFRDVHAPTWFERMRDRISQWLGDLIEWLTGRLSGYPIITRATSWVLMLLAAGALLAWMVKRLLRRHDTLRLDLSASPLADSTWQQMAREASEAAGRGDWREAIRLAYWSGIYRLEELGVWTVDRTRTHREYLRLIRRGQAQYEPLAALTRQFELAWYAARPSSAEDFQAAMTRVEKLGCALPSTGAIEPS